MDEPQVKLITREQGLSETKHNETLTKQDETIQVLNTSENNLEEQTILLLGGYDGINDDSLLMLENNEQSWKQLNITLPDSIHGHGAQFLNNRLYIFGGQYGEDEYLNCTYKLSKSLQWEEMANMNQKRHRISNSNVILNNQIWVCGGCNGNEWLTSVEMYDPLTNEWKYMKKMNQNRADAATAVVNGKIVCSGYDSVEFYDPSSDVWTTICNLPKEIWGHGAVEIDGNFIVMGGADEIAFFLHRLNNVWALNTRDRNAEWIEKSSMSIPRRLFSMAKLDDKIFICGGEVKMFISTDVVEIFDGEVWRNGPKLPNYRREAAAVVIPMAFARELEEFADDPFESSEE